MTTTPAITPPAIGPAGGLDFVIFLFSAEKEGVDDEEESVGMAYVELDVVTMLA
jgi:hypothetical protein